MTNPETGETMEMSMEELMEAMREGKVTVQQQVHHADGTVTSSTIYGNDIGDGIDRSLNIFGTMNDIFMPALQMAKRIKEADENAENIFRMDDSDVDYEVTIDDTSMPIMHIITSSKESVTIARYSRDERKTVGEPINSLNILFEDGEIVATLEEVQENNLALFAFGVYELRRILRERGILQELQRIGNKSSGVMITAVSEENIDARIVRGKARPELPCMMFGGLFAQGPEDAIMMRPYVDELMTDALYEGMSLEGKIEAAEDGDTDIMEELAEAYLNGIGVETDFPKAVYWFKKLAETGNAMAMFNVGLHYAKGCGVERSFENAVYWMRKAAENGDDDASQLIEKLSKAIVAEKTALLGDAQAQAELASVYMFLGNSLDQADYEEEYAIAFDYAQKAALQNNAEGIWTLALCYEHGRGVDEDVDKAIELYRKGTELGHAPSQHSLACYLMRGDYLDAEPETAFSLFEKSALQGYKLAEFSLCKMYELGEGTEQDLDKAIEWGEKAATDGDANTQYEVAKLYTYTNENGEMIDAERAKYWYSQAAEKGHEMAAGALSFGPMWGDMEGFDESDLNFDAENTDDAEVKEELKIQAKKFMSTVIAKDDGTIKNLLTNMTRNCLSTVDNFENDDFEKLCEEGYILFDIDDINWEVAKDCFIVFSKEESDNLFGESDVQYVFNIICKMCVNDLDGYKTRTLELCSALSGMLNGYDIDGDEKLYYMMCSSQILSDEYNLTSIYFSSNDLYSSNEGVNIFAGYAKDSHIIFEKLFNDKDIQNIIGSSVKTPAEAYDNGYIQLNENFTENDEKGYSSWIIATWEFSFETSLNIIPVVRNKKQLIPMISAIKRSLKGVILPNRGTINYDADVSQEKLDLTDKLVAAILVFK